MPLRGRQLEHPQDLPVSIELENLTGDGVAFVDQMIGSDEETERMADMLPFGEEVALGVEDLDSLVVAVSDVNSISIDGDRVGQIELARPAALHAPSGDENPRLVVLHDARVSVAVRDVDVPS